MTSDVNHTGIHWKAGMGWEHVSVPSRKLVNQFEYICAASGGVDWTLGCISIKHSTFIELRWDWGGNKCILNFVKNEEKL